METNNETGKAPEAAEKTTTTVAQPNNSKLTIAIVALIVVIIAATAVIVDVTLRGKDPGDAPVSEGLTIGYATDASVFLDEKSLQAAMDEALRNAAERNVALWYQNEAYSTDGVTFTCYIGNSGANLYDMFLTIFADAELTDQVYMSQLIRPGSGFERIKLSHALEPGAHTMYVAATLVETGSDGTQVIKSQVIHTIEFYVLD